MSTMEFIESKKQAKHRINVCAFLGALAIVLMATAPVFADAVGINTKTASTIGSLPAQALLALVALGSLSFAAWTVNKMVKMQEEHYKGALALAKQLHERPCLLTMTEAKAKYCEN